MTEKRHLYLEPITIIAFLALVIFACVKIILPFSGAILWAAIIVVATWPLYLRLRKRFGSRSKPAIAIMTIGLALVLVGPVAVLTASLPEHRFRSQCFSGLDRREAAGESAGLDGQSAPREWSA